MNARERSAAHLSRLARTPRPAGSAAEAEARGYCRDVLASCGFSVTEEPFAYSEFVGRWGTPVIGLSALGLFLAACLSAGTDALRAAVAAAESAAPPGATEPSPATTALALLLAGGVALAITGTLLARRGVLRWPTHRREGVNLVARRGGGAGTRASAGEDEGRVWLVAHVDSKSQPVPILLRAVGIAAFAALWLVAIAMALAGAGLGVKAALAWTALGTAGTLAALPIVLTTVGADSPGALDNASGVATVLLAAELATRDRPLGVLITSAEELGLAGARGWALAPGRRPGTAVNVDGVDDGGVVTVMRHGARSRALASRLEAAGRVAGEPVRVRGLIPGVLTDGVALADTGWVVVTVSRGGLGTLARIHTRRDDLSTLAGDGVARTAALIARALPELA